MSDLLHQGPGSLAMRFRAATPGALMAMSRAMAEGPMGSKRWMGQAVMVDGLGGPHQWACWGFFIS